jgi:hypothetical protein
MKAEQNLFSVHRILLSASIYRYFKDYLASRSFWIVSTTTELRHLREENCLVEIGNCMLEDESFQGRKSNVLISP